jgi:hypothetical protein
MRLDSPWARASALGLLIAAAGCDDSQPLVSQPTPVVVATPTPAPPATAGNQPPLLHVKTTPAADIEGVIRGQANANGILDVEFNLCPSSDPEGDTLVFTHDADGDGRDEKVGPTGAGCRRQYLYRAPDFGFERYETRQCVVDTDEKGAWRHDPVCRGYKIEVTGARPERVASGPPRPPNALPFADGLFGFVNCPGSGQINLRLNDADADAISWTVDLTGGTLTSPASGGPVASGTMITVTFNIATGPGARVFTLEMVDARRGRSVPALRFGPTAFGACGTFEIWY